MKKILGILGILLSFSSAEAKGRYGLGVILGAPTGISFNYKVSKKRSYDGALSFSSDRGESYYIHGDILWRKPRSLPLEGVKLGWYYGAGVRFRDHEKKYNEDQMRLGVRGVLGGNYEFRNPSIEVFLESSFNVDLIEETDMDIDIGIGARFYF